jgi:cytochrome c-type biogenesis protein CcsB
MKKISLLLALIFSFSLNAKALDVGERLRALPVQADGRIKPFDTFAQEMLEVVYGKKTFEKREAFEIILTWMLSPQAWQEKELFEVKNHEVLKALKLDEKRRYFRGDEIFANDRFSLLRQELQEKRDSKEKLTPYFQALSRIENQFFVFTEMATGRLMRVSPAAEGDAWLSVAQLEGESQKRFLEITSRFIIMISSTATGKSESEVLEAKKALDQSVVDFENSMRQMHPTNYVNQTKIDVEVHYNLFHPFRWASVFYILTSLLLMFSWITSKNSRMGFVWFLVACGFLLQTYGFGLRVYLTDRPPVSNMYETVVWVVWGSLVFSVILELIYKFKFILLAGTIVASIGMIIADVAPAILDPSLQPLEPVLRSNYWLVVHVMTITISYSAFFLAFILGDIGLFYYLKGEEKHKEKIKSIVLAIYRSIQIGVVFLGPGIILGGIWADYSWGRFWGWDPKETWALIVILGYIAVLHGRLTGWVKDFGMVVAGILTFALVIMAWYGVNFVLGAGLHSYGFGAGGVEYVSAFVLIHILAVIYVWVIRSSK